MNFYLDGYSGPVYLKSMKRLLKYLMIMVTAPVICSGCAGQFERTEEIQEDLYTDILADGKAAARAYSAEITLRHLPPAQAGKLFRAGRTPLLLFMTAVENTGSSAIPIPEVFIKYSGRVLPALSAEEAAEKIPAGKDSISLLLPRRRLPSELYFRTPEFPEDTINYKLDCILPGDTIVQIRAFECPPVSVRTYRIEFQMSQNDRHNSGFTIKRREFRTKGKDFLKPPDILEIFNDGY